MSLLKYLKTVPLLKLLFPFCIGIWLQNYFMWPYQLIFPLLCLLLFFLVLFHFFSKKLAYGATVIWYILIFLIITLIGCFAISVKQNTFNSIENKLKNSQAIAGTIASNPIKSNNKITFQLQIEQIKTNAVWEKVHTYCLLNMFLTNITDLHVGQKIALLNPTIQTQKPDYFPYQYNYLVFNRKKNVIGILSIHKTNQLVILQESNTSFKYQIEKIRTHLIEKISHLIPEKREQAILSSLVLGYRTEIDSDLKQAYSAAGVMHILSVSGLHVGIVYLFLSYTLYFLRNKSKWVIIRTAIIILAIWIYALLTGSSPPVIRSATMFTFFALGELLNRQTISFNMVFVSALFMLAIEPYLLFDVGFQLSYAAIIGILIFYKPFSQIFQFSSAIPSKINDLVAVSIAAQLGTLPFTLLYFHSFPTYFILSNIVIVPLSAACLYAGLTLLFFLPVNWLANPIAQLLELLIQFMNTIILKIESLPMATISCNYVNSLHFLTLLILIGIIGYIIYFRNYKWIIAVFSLILLLQTNSLINKYLIYNKKEIIIGKFIRQPYITIKHFDKLYIFHYSTDTNYIKYVTKNYALINNIKSIEYINIDTFQKPNLTDIQFKIIYFNRIFTLVYDNIAIIFSENTFCASNFINEHKLSAIFRKIKIMNNNFQYYIYQHKNQLNIQTYNNYHIITL